LGKAFQKALCQWCHLSAFLISASGSNLKLPPLGKASIQSAIFKNVAQLNSILKPFIKQGCEPQRLQEENLLLN
jgi:hypothetical protein